MLYADEVAGRRVRGMVAPGYNLHDAQAYGIGNIFEAIGLKSTYTQTRGGGQAGLSQIFTEYSNSLDYNLGRIERIPKGTAQDKLRQTAGPAITLRSGLDPMFAPGAAPGSKDEANLNAFVAQVKQLAKEVEAAEKLYGISAPSVIAAKTSGALAKMGLPNIPLWGWGLAAIGALALVRKLRKSKGRRK